MIIDVLSSFFSSFDQIVKLVWQKLFASRSNVRGQIYASIYSRQMEAIVYIFSLCIYITSVPLALKDAFTKNSNIFKDL